MPLTVKVGSSLIMLYPDDQPGSVSDNRPDGRDVYAFECAEDDTHSAIWRSKSGADIEGGITREIIALGGLELVKELRKDESYDLSITTPKGTKALLRFTHECL